MKKMKVIQIVPSFGVGGAEKIVVDYLSYFDKESTEIMAISLYENKNTIYDKFIKENELNVIYLNKKPGLDFSMLYKINKIIREFNPDVVHTHLYTMKYVLLSLLNKKNIKVFHTIHNEPHKDANILDRFANWVSFKFLKATPISLTREMSKKIKSFYGINRVEVINNGINLKNFKDIKKNKKENRIKNGFLNDEFLIGHVGRFSTQKNHDFMIEIFKQFNLKFPNSRLLLIGDGELKNQIENKINEYDLSEKVTLLGVRSDVNELMSCLDVFLFPSLHEGFPVTLIEAQAADIKCVISNSIDRNIILNEKTLVLDLNDSIQEWCNYIHNDSLKVKPENSIIDYDIYEVVKKIVRLYENQ